MDAPWSTTGSFRITIAELNQLPDDDVVEALKELRKPKRYVQGTRGRKLTMRVIVTTLDDNHSHETQLSLTVAVLALASVDPSLKATISILRNSYGLYLSTIPMVLSP